MGGYVMTSTNSTVRGLEARRASLAPGAYLAIVHVSPGERLGPIGRGAVLPEVLDHVEAIETELAAARAIPAHTQAFIDSVREALGKSVPGHTATERTIRRFNNIETALDLIDDVMRGAR